MTFQDWQHMISKFSIYSILYSRVDQIRDVSGPIFTACIWNLVEVVEELLPGDKMYDLHLSPDNVGADLKDEDSCMPLSWAARKGYEVVVRLLIKRKDVKADSKDKLGQTPLW
jgi:ankyrin repeat protein